MTPEQYAYEVLRKIAATPFAGRPDESPTAIVAATIREATAEMALDAARYRWLRAGNAYRPEEMGVTGGEPLDALCDDGLSGGIGDPNALQPTPSLDHIAADLGDPKTFQRGFDTDTEFRERIKASIDKGSRRAPKIFRP